MKDFKNLQDSANNLVAAVESLEAEMSSIINSAIKELNDPKQKAFLKDAYKKAKAGEITSKQFEKMSKDIFKK